MVSALEIEPDNVCERTVQAECVSVVLQPKFPEEKLDALRFICDTGGLVLSPDPTIMKTVSSVYSFF